MISTMSSFRGLNGDRDDSNADCVDKGDEEMEELSSVPCSLSIPLSLFASVSESVNESSATVPPSLKRRYSLSRVRLGAAQVLSIPPMMVWRLPERSMLSHTVAG